jgi:hypothetical protein
VFTWVYKYRYWDEERQKNAVSQDAFTMEAIRSGLGVPLVESGMRVRHQDVDDSGRFRAFVPGEVPPPAASGVPAKES